MDSTAKINKYIDMSIGWQAKNLKFFRKLVNKASKEIEEGWKWDVPVFLINKKLVCAMSTFKGHTKFNFFDGASLDDQSGLFNSGLDSKKHRSINLTEGGKIDKEGLLDLIEKAISKHQ